MIKNKGMVHPERCITGGGWWIQLTCTRIQQVSVIDHDSGDILILPPQLNICKVEFMCGITDGY